MNTYPFFNRQRCFASFTGCGLLLVSFSLFITGCNQQNAGSGPEQSTTTDGGETGAQTDDSKPKVLVLNKEGKLVPEDEVEERPDVWDPEGIKDFELTERSGRKVTMEDLEGHPWVAGFIFTNCTSHCMTISRQMYELQEWLEGTDTKLVTITVDPKRDTPEQLKEYAYRVAADEDRWLFLTGDTEELYRVARQDFKAPAGEVAGEPFHTKNLFHVDATGRIIGKYDAFDEAEMAALKKALKPESSSDRPAEAEKPQPAAAADE